MKTYLFIFITAFTAMLTACSSPKIEQQPVAGEDSVQITQDSDSLIAENTVSEEDIAYTKEASDLKNIKVLIDKMWELALTKSDPVLKKTGMEIIYKSVEEDEEEPITYIEYYCARNAKASTDKDGLFLPEPTGPHAIVVGVNLATDNDEYVYFSDKEDFDAFKAQTAKDTEIGWTFSQTKTWYIARGHMG